MVLSKIQQQPVRCPDRLHRRQRLQHPILTGGGGDPPSRRRRCRYAGGVGTRILSESDHIPPIQGGAAAGAPHRRFAGHRHRHRHMPRPMELKKQLGLIKGKVRLHPPAILIAVIAGCHQHRQPVFPRLHQSVQRIGIAAAAMSGALMRQQRIVRMPDIIIGQQGHEIRRIHRPAVAIRPKEAQPAQVQPQLLAHPGCKRLAKLLHHPVIGGSGDPSSGGQRRQGLEIRRFLHRLTRPGNGTHRPAVAFPGMQPGGRAPQRRRRQPEDRCIDHRPSAVLPQGQRHRLVGAQRRRRKAELYIVRIHPYRIHAAVAGQIHRTYHPFLLYYTPPDCGTSTALLLQNCSPLTFSMLFVIFSTIQGPGYLCLF